MNGVLTPLVLELVRQLLRWAGVWLMTIGVPDSMVALTANEEVIVGIAGFISYALADGGWIVAKWRQWRAS